MSVKYVEKYPKTIEALKAAGIDYTLVLRDDVSEDGYVVIDRDISGVITSDGYGGILKTFVLYPSPEAAKNIWEAYKEEAGL